MTLPVAPTTILVDLSIAALQFSDDLFQLAKNPKIWKPTVFKNNECNMLESSISIKFNILSELLQLGAAKKSYANPSLPPLTTWLQLIELSTFARRRSE